jgi:hypothetical protein
MIGLLTPGVIGGILLVLGAFFTYKGNMYIAVGVYFLADIAWVVLNIQSGDIFGSICTGLGMFLGLLAFLKMHYGKMYKSIKK